MALLKSSIGYDSAPIIRGRGVQLRAPQMTDYPEWAEVRAVSRDHLMPWEPLWARDELTRSAFRRRVRHYQREAREDQGYAFLIFAASQPSNPAAAHASMQMPSFGARLSRPLAVVTADNKVPTLVGGVTLSHIRRGVTQAATLGYWLGAPFVGRGLMSDALGALLPFAFDVLRLHRVEAAVMPQNAPSLEVLKRLGFTQEGLARRYLKIHGTWQDHLTFALLAEDIGRADGVRT